MSETTKAMRRTRSAREPPVKKRILIVDDHPLVRQGLIALINSDPDLAVCGEASTCQAALQGIVPRRHDRFAKPPTDPLYGCCRAIHANQLSREVGTGRHRFVDSVRLADEVRVCRTDDDSCVI